MSSEIFLSNAHQTLDETWEWYVSLKSSVERERERLVVAVINRATEGFPKNLLFLTPENIRSYFDELLAEFNHAACLQLFASAEAELWVNFYSRVENKKKDPISKSFRNLWKEKQSVKKKVKVRLDELLGKWVENKPNVKGIVGFFNGLKNHRDWLAHGRYWNQDLGHELHSYNPDYYEEIISRMLNDLGLRSIK